MPNNIDMGGFGSPGLPAKTRLDGSLLVDANGLGSTPLAEFQFGGAARSYISKFGTLCVHAANQNAQPSTDTGVGGWYGALGFFVAGALCGAVNASGLNVSSAQAISWNNDVRLWRFAAGHLVLRNATTPQQFSVANTDTSNSGTNYEYVTLQWSSNVAYVTTVAAGTGTRRLLIPVTNPTTVAGLPAAATAGAGARSMVTDATVTTFASVVAGGGANAVPVYSDGTDWRIG